MFLVAQGKTNLKYILIVVILAVIAGIGIFGYYYLWIKDLEARLAELELRIPQKVITDETANWKTYTSQLKFSFKYPNTLMRGSDYGEMAYYAVRFSNYAFKVDDGDSCEGKVDCFTLTQETIVSALSDEYEFVSKIAVGASNTDNNATGPITHARLENFTSGGYDWLRYDTERGGKWTPKYSHSFSLKKGNNFYRFVISSDSKSAVTNNKQLLEKIVSTFRFIE